MSLMLLKQVLNNLPISLDGPWNYIFTNVSIKVNLFRQKNVYYIYNYVHKSMENFLFWNKYFFSSYVFFKNVGKDYTLKDYSQKIIKKKFFQFCVDCESNKYMVRIIFSKNFRRAHHNCWNLKLIISYSILSLAS